MPIKATACFCGTAPSLIRNFLQKVGYSDWLNIPIVQGKEKSKKMLESMPQFPEVQELSHFLDDASKWAVIIGYGEGGCRWADIAHNVTKSKIEAEFIVERFS